MAKRVLVVDDNPEVVRLIEDALAIAGFDVTSAPNGAECLRLIAAQPPDLVILDVQMPVLNGLDTLRLLRRSSDRRHLPVIVLSGRGAFEDVCDGWTQGANLYLTKPVQIEAVVSAVRWMLGLDERKGPVLSEVVAPDL